MEFFDSHCHLDAGHYGEDLSQVVLRARAAGVDGMAVIGTCANDSQAAIDFVKDHSGFVASVGIHPNDVGQALSTDWDEIIRLVVSGRAAAIGETGLDWFRDSSPQELQRDYFDRHIRLSRKMGLPLVVHMRESTADAIAMIREASSRGTVRAILHSFTGTSEQMMEAVELGCMIGVSGMITFRTAQALRDVAKMIPSDQLLLETDSPFLSPEPLRGKKNEPSHVVHTAHALAVLRDETIQRIAAVTTANAKRIFCVGSISS